MADALVGAGGSTTVAHPSSMLSQPNLVRVDAEFSPDTPGNREDDISPESLVFQLLVLRPTWISNRDE